MSFEYLNRAFALLSGAAHGENVLPAITSGDPIAIAAALFAGMVAYCFLGGVITNTHSFVDQLWSLAPIGYAWIFAARAGGDPRVLLMAALVTAWGIRLTYNFARKGGYNGEEDYRWEVLRSRYIKSRVAFELFNLTYISTVQHVLIFLFTSPIAFVWYETSKAKAPIPWNGLDIIAGAGCIFFLIMETVADQQQWAFQSAKHGKAPRVPQLADDYSRGFLTHGLFALSRHPNFFAEQSFWLCFAVFTAAVTGAVTVAGFIGAALLIFNFHFSTDFGEGISGEKYKEYKVYQKVTSRLLPWFPGDIKKAA